MGQYYEELMTSIEEAIADAKAEDKTLKRRVVTIIPVKEYNSTEIKEIRKNTGLSQKLFAMLSWCFQQNG